MAVATMTLCCSASANVGAVGGQTHAVTTRSIFGRIGSGIVSALLVIDGMGFYLFTVLFIISLAQALLGTIPALGLVTAALALVMIFNNYFGFTGLQRFAQYVAVPVMVVWGVYAVIKAFASVNGSAIAALPHTDSPAPFFLVVGSMVGLSTWGNEPDVFRYAKAGRASWWNIPTLAVSYFLGAFLFPVMGYLVAVLSGQPYCSASILCFATFTWVGLSGVMCMMRPVNKGRAKEGTR